MKPDAAVVTAPVVPVRADADHRAEQVSQWILGEVLAIAAAHGDWILARGPDGYEGWATAGGLRTCPESDADGWKRRATLRSLGARYRLDGAERSRLTPLPWGAWVEPTGPAQPEPEAAGMRAVLLPDGSRARVLDPARLFDGRDRATRPADGPSVIASAREWLGAPYLWGGRTELGVDCSGFVQAVFDLHGIDLPRDSGPQSHAHRSIGPEARQAGDLLFFAPEGRGITHVGIGTGGSGMIHAASSNGRVAEDDLEAPGERAARLRRSMVRVTRPLGDPR